MGKTEVIKRLNKITPLEDVSQDSGEQGTVRLSLETFIRANIPGLDKDGALVKDYSVSDEEVTVTVSKGKVSRVLTREGEILKGRAE